jgi:hypothetical protein
MTTHADAWQFPRGHADEEVARVARNHRIAAADYLDELVRRGCTVEIVDEGDEWRNPLKITKRVTTEVTL